jgi:hypothetical protein
MISLRFTALLLVALFVGCGYHTPGAVEKWVGGDARVVYIQLFVNQTSEPYLENYLTNALVAELARSRTIRVTENPDLADLVLRGEIRDFSSKSLAYGSKDRINAYRAAMSVEALLVRRGSDEVLWRQKRQRYEDYPATEDKNLQLEGQRLAAREIAQRLAEDLYASLLYNF